MSILKMKKLYTTSLLLLFTLLLQVPVSAKAAKMVYQDTISSIGFEIPKKPKLQTAMYDYAKVLSESERLLLENKLVRYSDTTTTQIVIITIESLKGEGIGELTPRWADTWGIGQAGKNNGVLILLAKAERKIWISPGYGVDDRLTAGILGQVIRDEIVPELKTGDYYTGLDKGTDAIFRLLQGKYKAKKNEGLPVFLQIILLEIVFFILCFIYQAFASVKADSRSYGYRNYGRTSGGSSGHSSGSSRSGFRGGFGGGRFSGGGAGGSW